MDWLSQNWIWIAVVVGGYFLMSRMGMGGCGMGHSHGRSHGSSNHQHGSDSSPNVRDAGPGHMFDPVSQHMLPASATISSVHKGHVYYFEDRANRDAFENNPEKYLDATQIVGQEAVSSGASTKQSHQRHGCC